MKINNKKMKFTAAVLAAILTASTLMGCSQSGDNNKTDGKVQENQTENSQSGNQAQQDPVEGGQIPVGEEGGDVIKFKPSEQGVPVLDKYEYPYIGLTAVLTDMIKEKMAARDLIMLTDEDYTADYNVKYATMHWYTLTEEQKNEEVEAYDPYAWRAGLAGVGVLGVYNEEAAAQLDELTGCTQHKEIGKSEDGKYVYYLSFADGADEELKKELEKTEVELIPMDQVDPYAGSSAFAEGRVDTTNVGTFKTTDINGKEYTEELFRGYDLTLVNVFATWCSPCVQEMPELEKLKQEMADQGVNVATVVYDSVNEAGVPNEEALEMAKLLTEKAKLTFPMLIPDETGMNGRLKGITGYPESFFVDGNGNIVGETYVGAHSFEGWKEIVEKELANLKGAE